MAMRSRSVASGRGRRHGGARHPPGRMVQLRVAHIMLRKVKSAAAGRVARPATLVFLGRVLEAVGLGQSWPADHRSRPVTPQVVERSIRDRLRVMDRPAHRPPRSAPTRARRYRQAGHHLVAAATINLTRSRRSRRRWPARRPTTAGRRRSATANVAPLVPPKPSRPSARSRRRPRAWPLTRPRGCRRPTGPPPARSALAPP